MRFINPLVVALLVGIAGPAFARQDAQPPTPEAHLRRVLEKVAEQRLDVALEEAEALTRRHPNFRLAHLIRGDLLLARTRPLPGLGHGAGGASERLEELRQEALQRLKAHSQRPEPGSLPGHLVSLDPRQKHAVVVDTSASRVYLFKNESGVPRLVLDFYTTIGKRGIQKEREGDQKTPLGVYLVTSHIPGRKLPDLYGWGAFPLNYPNEWDRMRGRTGYGIWIHGVPSDTYARAPLASDGCVALANDDMAILADYVQPGSTPVVITERIQWLSEQAWKTERDAFLLQLERWRSDWESRDTRRFLSHYATGFRSNGKDLEGWTAQKRSANARKKWIKVALTNLSVLRSDQDMVVATFEQDYRSNNLSQHIFKRQYWVREGAGWKIAYESPVRRAAPVLPESFPGKASAR